MMKKEKMEARKLGMTERAIYLIEESLKFVNNIKSENPNILKNLKDIEKELDKIMNENQDLLKDIENEEQFKRAEEIIKKLENYDKEFKRIKEIIKKLDWYKREIDIEIEKSKEPYKLIEKYIIIDKDKDKAM